MNHEIPELLPVLPLKTTVVFPDAVAPLAIGEPRSIRLIDDIMDRPVRMVAMVTSRDPDAIEPPPDGIHQVGTAALVQKMLRAPEGVRILAQGLVRVRLTEFTRTEPYLEARVEVLPDREASGDEVEALARNLQAVFSRIVDLVPYLPEELQVAAANIDDPNTLSYLIASSMRLRTEERQELLEEPDPEVRLRRLLVLCNREVEVLELGAKIQSDVQSDMDQQQREYFLRQQLKAIQAELGEMDPEQAEVNELRERLEAANPPEAVRAAADRELDRLARMPSQSGEHSVIRTYLEWLVSMPWGVTTEDDLDLEHARAVLDEDHHGLHQVKERIVEYLAVLRLNPDAPAPILCFAGPPGVGKTSLGQSIARALGRRFARISLGGVRDESEIRGHRRTYIGAMPGTPVRAIRDAESMNPVLLIDEIDKLGGDVRGDPGSAMLEVLDPAQNSTFRDHYLDLPLDLSRVLFVCTANVLDTISRPLLDRMEVIQLSGYTDREKHAIARRYLVPRQLRNAGLTASRVRISDAGLETVISEYTREAGVRQLERRLGAITRKIARRVAEGETGRFSVGRAQARELLGPERIHPEVRRRTAEPGVATGLAVTGAGGDILFVECGVMPGSGRLTITGQLGEVMRESAQAALTYVRAHARDIGLDLPDDHFAQHDIHLHVPAGAIPKDGPSAGITIVSALVSALSGHPVSADVAMTGEVTITGQVLPIGGVKEKTLAAERAGIRTVIIPRLNEDGLADLPDDLRERLDIHPVDRVEDVLRIAVPGLLPPAAPGRRRRGGR